MNHDITGHLDRWSQGDPAALNELFQMVYHHLKHLAESCFRREQHQVTLQPTIVLHELYLRLAKGSPLAFEHREQFFGFASRIMRQVLVDHARARKRVKRGSGIVFNPLEEDQVGQKAIDYETLLAFDQALNKLTQIDPDKSQILEMWYFGGMSSTEIAQVQDISRATAKRQIRAAKLWILSHLPQSPRSLAL